MKISALPLEATNSKLRANFNANLAAVALPDYNVKPFTLDFPASPYSGNTKSVIFGQFTPDDVESWGPCDFNRAVLYVTVSANKNLEKPRDFSGDVIIAVDFHLNWKSSDLKQPFESVPLSVEDAFAETIQLVTVQNWGAGVVYDGEFTCVRGPVIKPVQGQGSLRQLLAFRLGFQLFT